MGTTTLLIGILTRNILKPEVSTTSGPKVMAQIVVFVFSVTLTFDLCSQYEWVIKNALCFIMGYLVAMEIHVALFLLAHFFICYIV